VGITVGAREVPGSEGRDKSSSSSSSSSSSGGGGGSSSKQTPDPKILM